MSISTFSRGHSPYASWTLQELLNMIKLLNEFMNVKGVNYIESHLAFLMNAKLFLLSSVCTDMHKQTR